MLGRIREIADLLGVNTFWIWLIIILTGVYCIVRCMLPWRPEWKSRKTKDENGNEITKYYHLDI